MIRNRLAQYHSKTEPLVAYYEEQGALAAGRRSLEPDEVHDRIRAMLATLRMEEEL